MNISSLLPAKKHSLDAVAQKSRARCAAVLSCMVFLATCVWPACHVRSQDRSALSENLLLNGDFSTADPSDPERPLGWQKPDGLGVKWVQADGGKAHTNMAICMDTRISEADMVAQWKLKGLDEWVFPDAKGDPIAATYGLSYYSDYFPVASGRAYRVSFRYKGSQGGAKVWVRGYGMLRGRERHLYDTIVTCTGKPADDGWIHLAQTFHPTHHRPAVTRARVMLFAYWPPGVYWFDDARVEPIPMDEWKREMAPAESADRQGKPAALPLTDDEKDDKEDQHDKADDPPPPRKP